MSLNEIFSQIYQKKQWGSKVSVGSDSGEGSDPDIALPYVNFVKQMIVKYKVGSVIDFGHGDWEMWRDYRFENVKYTYNAQKTPGKPYKVKAQKTKDAYGQEGRDEYENKTGDRHPKSVIKCHQSDEKLHPTQKPSDLCEWLIKTYSNENDVVLDFCMGSGSSIIGCIKSNRKYIGIEKDKSIFEVAQRRINNHKNIVMDV